MDHAPVLFFGRNPALMTIVDLQLKSAGIEAKGYMDEAELAAALREGHPRMLVIGGGVEEEARARVKALCQEHGVLVLEHSGGPQNLPDTISDALS